MEERGPKGSITVTIGHRQGSTAAGLANDQNSFLNSEKLLEPFEMEMSINLESRQLVMQVVSHLIRKKKKISSFKKPL